VATGGEEAVVVTCREQLVEDEMESIKEKLNDRVIKATVGVQVRVTVIANGWEAS